MNSDFCCCQAISVVSVGRCRLALCLLLLEDGESGSRDDREVAYVHSSGEGGVRSAVSNGNLYCRGDIASPRKLAGQGMGVSCGPLLIKVAIPGKWGSVRH